MLGELVRRADVRMPDARGDARLVEEHLLEGLVLRELREEHLQRDELVRLHDARRPHVGHAADADWHEQFVRTEHGAGPKVVALEHRSGRAQGRLLIIEEGFA
jgi:hypothetical protein